MAVTWSPIQLHQHKHIVGWAGLEHSLGHVQGHLWATHGPVAAQVEAVEERLALKVQHGGLDDSVDTLSGDRGSD